MHHVRLVPVVGQPMTFRPDLAHGIELRTERFQVEVDEKQAPLDQRQIIAVGRTFHQQFPAVSPVVPLLRRQNTDGIRTRGASRFLSVHYYVQQLRRDLLFGYGSRVLARSQSQHVKLLTGKMSQ